jgi:hypothetical protein
MIPSDQPITTRMRIAACDICGDQLPPDRHYRCVRCTGAAEAAIEDLRRERGRAVKPSDIRAIVDRREIEP